MQKILLLDFHSIRKLDSLFDHAELFIRSSSEVLEILHDSYDELFWSRGSRRHSDRRNSLKPSWIDILWTVDQICFFPHILCDMTKLRRVGTIFRSHDEDEIDSFGEDFHGFLSIGRRIADISCLREDDMGKELSCSSEDFLGIID